MSEVLFDVGTDGVAVVTLNNPARKNAVSIAAAQKLHELWATVEERADIKVLVIAAAECGVFCAGMDLAEVSRVRSERGLEIHELLPDGYYDRLRNLGKPVVAALNGHFTALGMLLAVHSDLRVGLAGSKAGITEARVGRGAAWTALMLDMVPKALVLELLLSAEMMPVERLREVGFLNYVEATPQAVNERAMALARSIARNAPMSLSIGKAGLRKVGELGLEAGYAASREMHLAVASSADAAEGVRAFTEKRAPVWQGR
ncbi:enoyl-CoA hydratase/isomerase family protein [Ramlibacter sp.]|uniref:enoyl-CoA hydratase/isomerase family protein n=1 Tax=Ramlibacter sp. TaxID=1917967 RepID=UPI003D0CBAC8